MAQKPPFDKTWLLPDTKESELNQRNINMPSSAHIGPPKAPAIPVTVDNFIRAESDLYFANIVRDDGFGRFMHKRVPTPIDEQLVIRTNRDTLYSAAVFDLDSGPVSITLPDPGMRFMSMQVFDEDEYVVEVVYGAGSHTYDKDGVGTRYIMVGIRTLVDPGDAEDLKTVHALQDAIQVEHQSIGRFEVPNWDPKTQKKVREALLTLGSTLPDMRHAFGGKDQVDPVRRLIGAAAAWGGNPEKDATYLNVTPGQNDGETVYRLTVKDVPVDAFWSIIVYNKDGYIPKNEHNVYSLNSITAKKSADESVTIQFGGYDGKTPNCLPIVPGWNYMVRLYRPRPEVLNGTWKFPEAQRVQ